MYRARHVDSGEELAIKLIKRGMDTDSVLRRFHNERRILETLNHPNIAKILDAGATPEGLPYFVMEYIAGQPISQYCDSTSSPSKRGCKLFEKVCAAVQCAHESHIVHRDIKPENILVTADGEPKLLDFGIAKVLDIAGPTQDATLTIIPVMTPHYASPGAGARRAGHPCQRHLFPRRAAIRIAGRDLRPTALGGKLGGVIRACHRL